MVAQLRPTRRTELTRRLRHSLPAERRQLDPILDDIELRARVELAKFGRYPGL